MVEAYLGRQGRGSGVFDLTGDEMLAPALHQSSALAEHVGPRVCLCDGIPELMGEGELAGCPVRTVLQRPGAEGCLETVQGRVESGSP